jgi:hypothetical protein
MVPGASEFSKNSEPGFARYFLVFVFGGFEVMELLHRWKGNRRVVHVFEDCPPQPAKDFIIYCTGLYPYR